MSCLYFILFSICLFLLGGYTGKYLAGESVPAYKVIITLIFTIYFLYEQRFKDSLRWRRTR